MRTEKSGIIFLVFIFATSWKLTLTFPCKGNISALEYGALNDLYYATNGENWVWNLDLESFSSEWIFPSTEASPCTDNWQGLLCSDLASPEKYVECTIFALQLPLTNLSGSIPTSLAQLSNLGHLDVSRNKIHGSIPSQVGELTNLTLMYLYTNALTGTIPRQIYELVNLQKLVLDTNHLQGRITSAIGQLTNLQELVLFSNSFTGTFPSELSDNDAMRIIALYDNFLTSTVPSSIGSLISLQQLAIYDNMLSGSIPSQLGYIVDLQILGLDSNYFTGTIPNDLGHMNNLNQLVLNNNYISGSIPPQIGVLNNLGLIYTFSNMLTSTIPSALGNITAVEELAVYDNLLSGSLPSELGNLLNAVALYFQGNFLTGRIPSQLGRLSNLQQLYLNDNSFTGSIPSEVGNLQSLILLYLDQNSLSGKVPASMFVESLELLTMYSNCFEGSLPPTICAAHNLTTVIMDELTSGGRCRVRLSHDLQGILRGPFPLNVLTGTIPDCLWGLPRLQTLHLSGNGLSGSLGTVSISQSLLDLDLSNNFLTGTIPISVQSHPSFQQLSLSHNKFSGSLSPNFVVGAEMILLSLSVNRLSSDIPSAFFTTNASLSLDVLSGNLFACTSDRLSSLDQAANSYICGSSNLDDSLYVWIVSLCAFVGIGVSIVMIHRHCSTSRESIVSDSIHRSNSSTVIDNDDNIPYSKGTMNSAAIFWNSFNRDLPRCTGRHSRSFVWLHEFLATFIIAVASLLLIICMTSFVVMKAAFSGHSPNSYGTISDQYTWVTTAAFLHGVVPAALLAVYVCVVEWGLLVAASAGTTVPLDLFTPVTASQESRTDDDSASTGRLEYSAPLPALDSSNEAVDQAHTDRSTGWASFVSILTIGSVKCEAWLFQFVNAAVVLAVNWGYVYAILFGQLSPARLLALQAGLSVFKIAWKQMFIKTFVSRMRRSFNQSIQASARFHELWVTVFNFIVCPCLATLGTDSNCMYYAFVGQAAVTSTFNENVLDTECVSKLGKAVCLTVQLPYHTSITTTPPWSYSYECSSAVITNYVPVLMLVYVVSGLLQPAIHCLVLFFPEIVRSMAWSRYLGSTLNHSIYSLDIKQDLLEDATRGQLNAPLLSDRDRASKSTNHTKSELFHGPSLIVGKLVDAAVLATFGLAAPLLAVAIAVKQVSDIVLWRFLLGRYFYTLVGNSSIQPVISNTTNNANTASSTLADLRPMRSEAFERLESATQSSRHGLVGLTAIAVLVSSLFWSGMVFDMLADLYGASTGGTASFVVFMCWGSIGVAVVIAARTEWARPGLQWFGGAHQAHHRWGAVAITTTRLGTGAGSISERDNFGRSDTLTDTFTARERGTGEAELESASDSRNSLVELSARHNEDFSARSSV